MILECFPCPLLQREKWEVFILRDPHESLLCELPACRQEGALLPEIQILRISLFIPHSSRLILRSYQRNIDNIELILYDISMKFEWDDTKSRSNKHKHGIDFQTATRLWYDPNRVEIETPYPLENRYILIGKVDKKYWAAIFTRRGKALRIISVRRARKKEVHLYEKACQE